MTLAARAAPVVVVALAVMSLSGCSLVDIATSTLRSQHEAAAAAKVKSELANAEIAATSFAVENNGSYSGMTRADLTGLGLVDIPANFRVVVDDSGTTFCLQGTTSLGQTLHVTGTGPFASGPCPSL